jgi:hypothetical protein
MPPGRRRINGGQRTGPGSRRQDAAETKAAGNGRPFRINPSGLAHLWTARCVNVGDPAHSIGMPVNGGRADQADLIEALGQAMGRYRAAVVDLGVVRLDARMLAMARPDDPVLVVARYGCSRRDELAATLAVVNLANRSIGGVILNGYKSPARSAAMDPGSAGKRPMSDAAGNHDTAQLPRRAAPQDRLSAVAVVGLGYWGPNWVRNLQGCGLCDRVVACDFDPQRRRHVEKIYPAVRTTTAWIRFWPTPRSTRWSSPLPCTLIGRRPADAWGRANRCSWKSRSRHRAGSARN